VRRRHDGRPIEQAPGKCDEITFSGVERGRELVFREMDRLQLADALLTQTAVRPDEELVAAPFYPGRGIVTEPGGWTIAQKSVPVAPGFEAATARGVHCVDSIDRGKTARRDARKVGNESFQAAGTQAAMTVPSELGDDERNIVIRALSA